MKHDWYYGSAEGLMAALWLAQPITVALLAPTYVPDLDSDRVWADVSAHEVVGTGYVQKVLANKTTPYDPGTDRTDLRADDVSWGPGAIFTAGYAAVYDNSGAKPLWSLVNYEENKVVNNGVFVLDWAAVGPLALIRVP